jgi:hypothetical protein
MSDRNKRPPSADPARDTPWAGDLPTPYGRHRLDTEETAEEFLNSLRELRVSTGTSYSAIARHSKLPRSTAHAMVGAGASLPARPEQVEQFVLGCGQSPEVAASWVLRWRRLRSQAWRQSPRKPRTKVEISRSTPLEPFEVTLISPNDSDRTSPRPDQPVAGCEPPADPDINHTYRWLALLVYTLLVVTFSVIMTLVLFASR